MTAACSTSLNNYDGNFHSKHSFNNCNHADDYSSKHSVYTVYQSIVDINSDDTISKLDNSTRHNDDGWSIHQSTLCTSFHRNDFVALLLA